MISMINFDSVLFSYFISFLSDRNSHTYGDGPGHWNVVA